MKGKNSSNCKVLYIASANRSGSTLLERLLGNHSQIFSVGELRNFRAYPDKNRRYFDPVYPLRCSCGKDIQGCAFWAEVFSKLGASMDEPQLNFCYVLGRPRKTEFDRVKRKFEKLFFEKYPSLFGNSFVQLAMGYKGIAENCYRLYDAVSIASKSRIVVDSSKLPHRFNALYHYAPGRIKILILYRHPLGTVHSIVKRGLPLEKAALEWIDSYKRNRIFLKNIPKSNVLTVRYEDLCENVDEELHRVCNFLDISFEYEMISSKNRKIRHSIGGSPSQFEKDEENILDKREYLKGLSDEEKKFALSIVGKAAKELGYCI